MNQSTSIKDTFLDTLSGAEKDSICGSRALIQGHIDVATENDLVTRHVLKEGLDRAMHAILHRYSSTESIQAALINAFGTWYLSQYKTSLKAIKPYSILKD